MPAPSAAAAAQARSEFFPLYINNLTKLTSPKGAFSYDSAQAMRTHMQADPAAMSQISSGAGEASERAVVRQGISRDNRSNNHACAPGPPGDQRESAKALCIILPFQAFRDVSMRNAA